MDDGCSLLASVATGVLLAFVGAPASASGPTPAEAVTAPRATPEVLRITVEPTIDDAALISKWIAERNSRIAEQVPSFESHQQWIAVEVTGDTYDFRVTVAPMRDGTVVGPAPEMVGCECNGESLLALVDDRIGHAVEQLQTAPLRKLGPDETRMSATPPEGADDTDDRIAPPASEPSVESERRKISGLGIAGIATAGFGVGALGGGVVMMVVEPPVVSGRPSFSRSLQPPGIAALAAGGAALAAGVSMLVVDVLQCRKADAPRRCERRGREVSRSRLEVGPSLEVRGGGVTVFGRF